MSETDSHETEESTEETATIEIDAAILENISRRDLIRGTAVGAAMLALGTAGVGSASAASSPQGTIPDPAEPAFLRVRGERLNLVPRQSDPSNPDGGEMWVVE
jgi:hypothetical protein